MNSKDKITPKTLTKHVSKCILNRMLLCIRVLKYNVLAISCGASCCPCICKLEKEYFTTPIRGTLCYGVYIEWLLRDGDFLPHQRRV